MAVKSLDRKWWQRIFGVPATGLPADPDCWSFQDGKISLDLSRAPELAEVATGLRLEGKGLTVRVLVVHGDDGNYRAYHNKCRHFGRRIDPVPGTTTVQCCSVNKATYDADGAVVAGPARRPLATYPVDVQDGKLIVSVS